MADVRHGTGRIVVVGASAGGVEATSQLVRSLPVDLAAPVLVTLHMSSNSPSALAAILDRAGPLPARQAVDGEELCDGVVLVARPDHHLLVEEGRVRVVRGPRENGHRPAIDPLFRSAARWYGARAVGVVLTGVLDDGSAGLRVLKQAGGVAVVQDPEDAMYDPMPRNALAATAVDHVVALADLGDLLAKVVSTLDERPEGGSAVDEPRIARELSLTTMEVSDPAVGESVAPSSRFSCPDCAGVLNEIKEGDGVRFRCRVGHAWAPESLLAAQTEGLETALWMALRTLEEKVSLSRRLAARAEENGSRHSLARFTEQAEDAQRGADAIRDLLMRSGALVQDAAAGA
jgi:two-component system chemotaxis response regulator CheB